ncbi:MAG: hypothetical protein K2O00_05210 [Muribaculaceae bacterium]|nr:hypothetical protein [Muribaculaceae bacterium]
MKLIRLLLLFTALATLSPAVNAQEKFRRGLEQSKFIPKGQWITGVSVSYSQSTNDNYQFFIVEDISGDNYTFKVSPMLLYSFQDNLAAGGKFGYQRSLIRIDDARVVLDSETDYKIDNLYSLSHNYYGMACFRNYISFGQNKRFGLFNEVQLQFGGGESKLCNGRGEDLTGTFERNYSFNVGLAPGMIMFLNNYSALEVNIGVLGFDYTHTKSVTDQIYVASRDSRSANFRINLFSITFGVAFYL